MKFNHFDIYNLYNIKYWIDGVIQNVYINTVFDKTHRVEWTNERDHQLDYR